jgi:hypothetical protein
MKTLTWDEIDARAQREADAWRADWAGQWLAGNRTSLHACTQGALAHMPDAVREACAAFAAITGAQPAPARLAFRLGINPERSPMAAACAEAGYILSRALAIHGAAPLQSAGCGTIGLDGLGD